MAIMKLESILNTFTTTIKHLDTLVEVNDNKSFNLGAKVEKLLSKEKALTKEAEAAAKIANKLRELLS